MYLDGVQEDIHYQLRKLNHRSSMNIHLFSNETFETCEFLSLLSYQKNCRHKQDIRKGHALHCSTFLLMSIFWFRIGGSNLCLLKNLGRNLKGGLRPRPAHPAKIPQLFQRAMSGNILEVHLSSASWIAVFTSYFYTIGHAYHIWIVVTISDCPKPAKLQELWLQIYKP